MGYMSKLIPAIFPHTFIEHFLNVNTIPGFEKKVVRKTSNTPAIMELVFQWLEIEKKKKNPTNKKDIRNDK